jgi:hypothetical protein
LVAVLDAPRLVVRTPSNILALMDVISVWCWSEGLTSFGTIFPGFRVPSDIMRRFTRQLLFALDYAHQSGVIHTGEHSSLDIGEEITKNHSN